MKGVRLATCLLVLCLSGGGCGDVRYSYAVRKSEVSNLIFHEHLVFSSTLNSPIDCLRHCVAREECAAFTFTQGQGSGMCRGHTNGTKDNKSASPLTEAFLLPSRYQEGTSSGNSSTGGSSGSTLQLYSPCVKESDCRESSPGAERWTCYKSRCLCALGFYFSCVTKDCIQNCNISALGNNFVYYSNLQLTASTVQQIFSVEVATGDPECHVQCLTKAGCSAVNMDYSTKTCTGLGTLDTVLSASDFTEKNSAAFQMIYCK